MRRSRGKRRERRKHQHAGEVGHDDDHDVVVLYCKSQNPHDRHKGCPPQAHVPELVHLLAPTPNREMHSILGDGYAGGDENVARQNRLMHDVPAIHTPHQHVRAVTPCHHRETARADCEGGHFRLVSEGFQGTDADNLVVTVVMMVVVVVLLLLAVGAAVVVAAVVAAAATAAGTSPLLVDVGFIPHSSDNVCAPNINISLALPARPRHSPQPHGLVR